MEVFLSNLPPFSEGRFREALKPIMKKLNIKVFRFKVRPQQGIGFIVFMTVEDGKAFLDAHGAVSIASKQPATPGKKHRLQTQHNPRLILFGTSIWCAPSHNSPQKMEIETLKYELKQEGYRKKRQEEKQSKQEAQPVLRTATTEWKAFELLEVSCGYIVYPEGKCSFRRDISWPQHRINAKIPVVKFVKSCVIIKMNGSIRIDIPLNSVMELVADPDQAIFTFILMETPRFYSTDNSDTTANQVNGRRAERCRLTQLGEEHKHIIGHASTYQLRVHPDLFRDKVKTLITRADLGFGITNGIQVPVCRTSLLKFPTTFDALTTWNLQMMARNERPKLPFSVIFQLQVMAWNNYLHPSVVIRIMELLKSRPKSARTISGAAIKQILRTIDFPSTDSYGAEFQPDEIVRRMEESQELIDQESSAEEDLLGDQKLVLDTPQNNEMMVPVYKATVTPTHIMLSGPEMEASNRVLRKYPNHTDHFIRVQFAEETGSDLYFNRHVSIDKVYDYFKKVMMEGINIGGRRYQFFGFSHSSLRSHSAWFVAPFVDDGTLYYHSKIIAGLGNFSKIRVVAKCAARVGQAFSDTPFTVNLAAHGISCRDIPDIKSPDGKRTFSDGVGSMSMEAMKQIQKNLPKSGSRATAFQIRFGGCKGMISLDSSLQGRIICIRAESMRKFESCDIQNLEICNIANSPLRLYLNHQLIQVLEDIGVSRNWFKTLQNDYVAQLKGITDSVYNTAIYLFQKSVGITIEFPKLLMHLEKHGLDYREDKLLSGILEATILHDLRVLKYKARIPVPNGVTLYGVIDEFNFLDEREVYVTFDTPEDRNLQEPTNGLPLLVTRSPTMHPGDVQPAQQRVPPLGHHLRNLKNCIVFSSRGERDLPSMLSGGDLDGDLYHIIWDFRISHKQLRFHKPAEYAPSPPKIHPKEVTREDIAEWFVDFMKSDQLGVISVRHKIVADLEPDGTLHPNCLALAELASTAVDFSKSGVAADVSKLQAIKAQHRPDLWVIATSFSQDAFLNLCRGPVVKFVDTTTLDMKYDDDEPSADTDEDDDVNRSYYESSKVLGVLFRAIDDENLWRKSFKAGSTRHPVQFWCKVNVFLDLQCSQYSLRWQNHEKKAENIKDLYQEAIHAAMREYAEMPHKPLSEVELFIGNVINKHGMQTRRQRENSDKMHSKFERISGAAWRMIRTCDVDVDCSIKYLLASGVDKEILAKGNREALERAIACFKVALDSDDTVHHRLKPLTFKIIAVSAALNELNRYSRFRNAWDNYEMKMSADKIAKEC